MKKTVSTFFTILCLLSMVLLIGLSLNIYPVKADWTWTETIYIKADGSIEPDTAPISTVDNITYTLTDNVVVELPEMTWTNAIVVERNNVIIDGNDYMLQGSGRGNGVSLTAMSNVTIRNVNITKFSTGVVLSESSNNTIAGNNIINNHLGIGVIDSSNNNLVYENYLGECVAALSFASSSNNVASRNNVTNKYMGGFNGISLSDASNNSICENNITNFEEAGIRLRFSDNNSILENIFVNSGLRVYYSYLNTVLDNVVNGKPLIYLEGVSDYLIENAGQVILINCKDIQVENLNISNTTIGVQLLGTNYTKIIGNDITNNYRGISLYESSNNSISYNNIRNDNNDGIMFSMSFNNSIFRNNITDHYYGIYMHTSSNNIICENNIANNLKSIRVEYSSDNIFYHNNFINNTGWTPVDIPEYASGYANFWDNGYPSGGNYWSDLRTGYTGEDANDDGIGDTEYVIDVNNTDRYPLMAQYVAPQDTTSPIISVLSPENKTYSANDVSLTFTVSESTSWMGYSLDGQANVTVTGNKTLPVLSDGLHSLIVYANDTAGNMGASEMVYFTIETQKAVPFPIEIVAVIVIIGVVGAVVFVYFTKFRK